MMWMEPQIMQTDAISGEFLMPSRVMRYRSNNLFAVSRSSDGMVFLLAEVVCTFRAKQYLQAFSQNELACIVNFGYKRL